MSKRLIRYEVHYPTPSGDVPARGHVDAQPSLRRDIDHVVVLPSELSAQFGEQLKYVDNDNNPQTAVATPGVAWLWIDATDDGDYANEWFWNITEWANGPGVRRYVVVPAGSSVVAGADLVDIDPSTYDPVDPPSPGWLPALQAETDAREAADADLQDQIDNITGSDVETVAGVSPVGGDVPEAGLKTALDLPANTAVEITNLDTRVDTIESTYATDAELASEAALARNANNLTSGTVADARIPSGITRDSELAAVATSGSASDITTGMLPTSVLPPLAINETFVVASQAAMLALTAERGDMAIRTDNGKTYVLASDSPTTLADWKEVLAAGQVQSVNGDTGVVVLDKADVGLANADNTSDVNKPVSTAQATAIGVVQSDIDAHEANTSNPHSVTKTQVGLGNADNTSDLNKPISTATQTSLTAQSLSPRMVIGEYFTAPYANNAAQTAPTLDTVYYVPFPIERSCTLDRIGIYIQAAAGASGVIRLGLYAADANGKPSTLILDAGTVVSTVATTAREATISQAVTRGLIYVAFVAQVNATGLTIPTSNRTNPFTGTTSLSDSVQGFARAHIQAGVTGALPASTTLGSTPGNRDPLVCLRASA